MIDSNAGSDAEEAIDLFEEPDGYYKPSPEPTFESFTRTNATNSYFSSTWTLLSVVQRPSIYGWLDSIHYGRIIFGMHQKSWLIIST